MVTDRRHAILRSEAKTFITHSPAGNISFTFMSVFLAPPFPMALGGSCRGTHMNVGYTIGVCHDWGILNLGTSLFSSQMANKPAYSLHPSLKMQAWEMAHMRKGHSLTFLVYPARTHKTLRAHGRSPLPTVLWFILTCPLTSKLKWAVSHHVHF